MSNYSRFERDFQQSSMVNDQLNMLYGELNFGGNNSEITLNLEEGTTSNSSGEENAKDSREPIKVKCVTFIQTSILMK